MPLLRDAIDEPQALSGSSVGPGKRFIKLLHPGYYEPDREQDDPNGDVLISLPVLDDGGVHHDTAHTACAILAANRWDGYFSHDRGGSMRILPPPDGILRERSYFFCLPSTSTSPGSTDRPYPVVARFSDWRFPHDNLPPIWGLLQNQLDDIERAGAGAGTRTGNGSCCLSNYVDGVEQAHLVPSSQSGWWSTNGMSQYCQTSLFSTDPINAQANFVALRCDIHRVFDERHFCFVPKMEDAGEDRDEEGDGDRNRSTSVPHLVGHVFNSTPGGQLPKLWHNRRLHALSSVVSVECLFARFAWTIFSPTIFRDFLYASAKPRRILTWDSESRKYIIESVDPERCRRIFAAARSRSDSPKKRSRGGDRGNNGEAEECDTRHDEVSSDLDGGYCGDSWFSIPPISSTADEAHGELERGRTRKRKIDDADNDYTQDTTPEECHRPKRVDLNAP
ncbi:hypothetical protein QQX98_004715 [Neonectria punicea]|uniref:HNH nuclease domain-containing protein n=1 Tax=Neonectria punicea TaxID=979145 RepID=A0ABR1H8B9_9HYPO